MLDPFGRSSSKRAFRLKSKDGISVSGAKNEPQNQPLVPSCLDYDNLSDARSRVEIETLRRGLGETWVRPRLELKNVVAKEQSEPHGGLEAMSSKEILEVKRPTKKTDEKQSRFRQRDLDKRE